MSFGGLVPILLAILFLLILAYGLKELFRAYDIAAPIRNVIFLVVFVVALIVLLTHFGLM